MELHMVAVIPRVGACHRLLHRRVCNAPDAHQLIAQDLHLGIQLFFIGQMLVMTAPADTEMYAAWSHAVWRGLQHLQQLTAREAALLLRQADTDALARQSKRDKDRASILE